MTSQQLLFHSIGEAYTYTGSPRISRQQDDLVIAWALDSTTGVLRYILELDKDHRGAQCGCQCISCGLPLTAVNAAKSTFQIRPHFRHPSATPKHACLLQTARLALCQSLQPGDIIDLPHRRRGAEVEGLSGQLYGAWVEHPAEKVHIASVSFHDGMTALLVLDDGRTLEVQIIGSAEVSVDTETAFSPKIMIVMDDVALASMSLDEIRQRLIPLLGKATWCAHWQDLPLDHLALDEAYKNAQDGLDWETDYQDLSVDLRRESLLHREIKAILNTTRHLRVPDWSNLATVDRTSHSHFHHTESSRIVHLHGATLERRLGRIIPDVIAHLVTGEDLLIEVTVSNKITTERLERIIEVNLPTLEIDISRMGGRVTREQLGQLVIEEIAGKKWLHHPAMALCSNSLLEEDLTVNDSVTRAIDSAQMNKVRMGPAARQNKKSGISRQYKFDDISEKQWQWAHSEYDLKRHARNHLETVDRDAHAAKSILRAIAESNTLESPLMFARTLAQREYNDKTNSLRYLFMTQFIIATLD